MLFTKRDFKKPELTDPADIRDLNDNSESLEEHLNAITGYGYGVTVQLGTDSIEVGKIHLNKITGDVDEGKYFLITAGTTWDNATKEEFNIKQKLDKGVGLQAENARVLEEQIENLVLGDSRVAKVDNGITKVVIVNCVVDIDGSLLGSGGEILELGIYGDDVVNGAQGSGVLSDDNGTFEPCSFFKNAENKIQIFFEKDKLLPSGNYSIRGNIASFSPS